ncbi:MAG: uracil-DNA glycosylase [Candidatus Pacebacteria bacterium]|nr:uracil-DNA glycosylase [Candidatus Paceibacterota bacterium]
MDKFAEMKKVRDEVVSFTESPLCQLRIKEGYLPVIGEGSHDAEIMFIGEAPGKNEAETGRPFCGASGRVLDELLLHINLDRKEVYVANILKDRPPLNRDPKPEEIEMYGPFLDRQIEIIKPKVVATLGRFSANYVMKRYGLDFEIEPISSMHGKKFQAEHFTVIPLFHPAVGVYDASRKDDLKKDFEILKEFVK